MPGRFRELIGLVVGMVSGSLRRVEVSGGALVANLSSLPPGE